MKLLCKIQTVRASVLKNPYLNARFHWNDQARSLLSTLRLWQSLALICLLITLVAVTGAMHIASQSKFIPYVVEVDKLGQAVAVSPAQLASSADPRVVRASLAAFFSNARLVTPDIALQRKAIFSVYAMLNSESPATAKMTDWLNGTEANNPFNRAARETVETEIITVLPQSADTWQIEWNEKIFDRNGVAIGKPYHMRALATIVINAPTGATSEDKIRQNPLGVYVKDFSWAKQSEGVGQ